MEKYKVPKLVEGPKGESSKQADMETLALNEDQDINETIKKHSIVGKILSNKTTKHLTIFAILRKAWNCGDDMECHWLGNNFYLFVFPSITDKMRVLYQRAWSVQDKLIVLKECPDGLTLEEIDFTTEDFWIQVLHLPIPLISNSNAIRIGNLFPKFHFSNLSEDSVVQWDGNLNIRVIIRVDDPIRTGFILKRSNNGDVTVKFRYERRAEFCYSCGRIGHARKECWYKEAMFKSASIYGPWLRAEIKGKRNFNRSTLPDRNIPVPAPNNGEGSKVNGEIKGKDPTSEDPLGKSPIIIPGSKDDHESTRESANVINASDTPIRAGTREDEVLPMSVTPQKGKEIIISKNSTKDKDVIEEEMEVDFANKEMVTTNDSLIYNNLKNIRVKKKRKREENDCDADFDLFSSAKRKALHGAINKDILQIGPGNWSDSGNGAGANEDWIRIAFFPKTFSLASPFINKIETAKSGRSYGAGRLTLIKKAARQKNCLEIARCAYDNVRIMDWGTDPYGMQIDSIPTMYIEEEMQIVENDPESPGSENETVVPVKADEFPEAHPHDE